MRGAVDLDNQLRVLANEIDDVTAQRRLSTKAKPLDLPSTQNAPHASLGGRRFVAQSSGDGG
jgi:hypothetical protein